LDVVHSNALNFETALPIDEPKTVMIPTKQAGEFNFSCGMDMFHGTIHIK
jgi:plastocyanin domain-containing protein